MNLISATSIIVTNVFFIMYYKDTSIFLGLYGKDTSVFLGLYGKICHINNIIFLKHQFSKHKICSIFKITLSKNMFITCVRST